MSDTHRHRRSGPQASDQPAGGDGGATAGRPRWVKVSLLVGLVLVLVLSVAKVAGLGDGHGPGRHGGGTPTSVVDGGGGHLPAVDDGP